jgi:hypothetical protein
MIMNKGNTENILQPCFSLNNARLEHVSIFKYLGSWIAIDARCKEDIKARIGMVKAAFWQTKKQ